MAPKDSQHHRQHAEDVHKTRPAAQERSASAETQPGHVASMSNTSSITAEPASAPSELVIPLNVIARADISRSLRELESIMEYFHQSALRGSQAKDLPVLGKVLDSIASTNNLNLLHPEDRDKLKAFLTHVKAKAPVVHMSFPSKPGEPFLAKIVQWFRSEAHPYTVLHVGLQPELAAGCLVRTSNKSFDFSFRRRFEQSKQKLIAALEEANKKMEAEASASAPEPSAPAEESVATAVAETPVAEPEVEAAKPAAAAEQAETSQEDPERVGL